ncbi:MAG: hypothetical protein IJG18_08975, partial [Kiritimatiellae bacterium]|nr:hypothetical protein [Kiritimatiellia bacterium]
MRAPRAISVLLLAAFVAATRLCPAAEEVPAKPVSNAKASESGTPENPGGGGGRGGNPPGGGNNRQGEATPGDPVGVFTGNAYESAEDLRVSCPDLDLVMFRHYSSGRMAGGHIGFGWLHSYDWRLVVDGRRVVVSSAGERG